MYLWDFSHLFEQKYRNENRAKSNNWYVNLYILIVLGFHTLLAARHH